jgi:hypothetical protein
MLEATIVDLVFTISLKRSTLNRQLSTSCSADYPIFGRTFGHLATIWMTAKIVLHALCMPLIELAWISASFTAKILSALKTRMLPKQPITLSARQRLGSLSAMRNSGHSASPRILYIAFVARGQRFLHC